MDFEQIKNHIEALKNKNQILKVFKILHKNNDKYIINETGLYIPLNLLKTNTINELYNYLQINNKIQVINPNDSLERLKTLKKINISHSEKILLKKINLNDLL